ncbi:hypothetical protein [uncultured Gammaproteobacteria bacterium]|nr:hypothetical protein [uncultured Gammaproteobacteria bacterium]CAC9961654.1 hypothetical protein [uncultured Gammaproteobacteria bacterium]
MCTYAIVNISINNKTPVVFYGRVDFLICIRKKHNYKVPIIPQNTSERVIRAKEAKVWLDY